MTAQRNPFAYGRKITLDTLDDLFAHHRSLTGGWSMKDDGGDDDPPGSSGGDDDPPKFEPITSQEQLDKVLGGRLAREREKFADYDQLKEKAAAHDQALEAAMTEQEKAVDAARKEGETAARQAADARIVRAEAKVALAGASARNAEVAAKLLDLTGITVGDDGEVDAAALKAKVDALKESDPYLFDDGTKPGPKPDRSQGGGGNDDKPSLDRGRAMYEQRRGKKTA